MTEREMEDLIAAYPDDFFPHKGFQLKGRQQSFAGVGRFDLLFVDRFATNILMELKAVPAKYEVATQLAKYRDELLARGEKHILMWLVAPSISNSVREFLDRIGIEYSEIHETEFRRVAERYGKAFGLPSGPNTMDSGSVSRDGTMTSMQRQSRKRTDVHFQRENVEMPNDVCYIRLSETDLSPGHLDWVGNDEKDRYVRHQPVRLSKSPLDIRLKWTSGAPQSQVHLIGCYRLNLRALLERGFVRLEGPDEPDLVRLLFAHHPDDGIYIRVRRETPRLKIGDFPPQ
ncbi:MAG: endonuclease NucS domain-containing protein [Terriglobales bacterium]